MTTPRALARGYGYLETIAHELAHLYLSRASRDRAPVWFHEGLAKVLEKVPLGQPIGAHLSPSNKALLAKHHEAGTLLPFSAFHPSIALLPTQEQAALAYAEAADFVEQFISEHGLEGLRLAIHQNALGLTIEEALEQVAGMNFHAMEEAWRSSLGRYTYDPDLKELEKRFVDEASEADDLKEMDNEAARKKLRLGDLLWDRGRPKAASVVYREAVELSPKNPILLSRLGRSSLEAGEIEEAIRAGELAIGYYPDHAPALSLLAQAYARADQPSQAIETARRAVGINPFDPAPHCVLGRLVEEPKERETERAACARLTR
ncbi:MAG: tetratricopeptide repeat protein [Sandaracinaceae bacterium]|nr:tetratricopeptide repeat protein [Sandaracinaceae bacterium]